MTNKTYLPILIQGIKAKTDLNQHRFVGFDGNYCQEGKKALGVIDVSTEKDQVCPYAVLGILLVETGGEIKAGDSVTSDSEGKAIKTSDNTEVNGYALDSAVLGEEIRIVRGI